MKSFTALFLTMITMVMAVSFAHQTYKTETIGGIGAVLEELPSGDVQINSVLQNTPAERAGLQLGDIIIQIRPKPDASLQDVRRLSLPRVVAMIRGPVGVPVELEYVRNGEVTLVSIFREEIVITDEG